MLLLATVISIVGGILAGVILTLIGQWWLSARHDRPALLGCQTMMIQTPQLAAFKVTQEQASEWGHSGLAHESTGLRLAVASVQFMNRGHRKIDAITAQIETGPASTIVGYALSPRPSDGFPVSVRISDDRTVLTAGVPYLNRGQVLNVTLAVLAAFSPSIPKVRVDAPDVRVKQTSLVVPVPASLIRVRSRLKIESDLSKADSDAVTE
jgi:hypothetical protein